MSSHDPGLTRILMANIIGYLAALHSEHQGVPLAAALQCVLDTNLYHEIMDADTVLYAENINLLYDQLCEQL